MFDLTKAEEKIFKKYNTPIKIQDYLDTLPINFEKNGETGMSPRRVLHEKKVHCFEGALLAAAILWFHGHEPLLLNLKAYPYDDDHSVALYKVNGLWGAISKSNHATVRFRDPIYTSVRELAVSYFHEYFLDTTGEKVLHSYSKAINLKRFGSKWITEEKDLFDMAAKIDQSPHFPFYPKKNKKYLRRADAMERKAGRFREWKH